MREVNILIAMIEADMAEIDLIKHRLKMGEK
jgi:hypothetical protein